MDEPQDFLKQLEQLIKNEIDDYKESKRIGIICAKNMKHLSKHIKLSIQLLIEENGVSMEFKE
jgi:hypothetical protein